MAVETLVGAPGSGRDLDGRLVLDRLAIRFIDPATETAFRDWSAREAVPFTRLGLVVSLAGWTGAWLALALGIPGTASQGAPWVFGVVWPVAGIGLFLTRWSDRRILWGAAGANVIAGFVAAGPIAHGVLDEISAATPVVIIVAFFGFTVFRLPPLMAAVAVGSYSAFNQVLLVASYRADEISTRFLSTHSIIMWTGVSTGMLVCVVLGRLSREAYRREQVIEEQQREIEREQERSEVLLRNVLPDSIAERLKWSTEPIADQFDEVSVLFADIVGFTPLASTMEPRDLVALLDLIFSGFDDLADAWGVEKIKTIGDAYMAVAGLPDSRSDHVEVIAELALEMRDELGRLRATTGHDISFRVGIATGPVVAGVIGRRKFAYDLWGHTVNMAARMESHGEPGEIQVTEAVHRLLADRYELVPRGRVKVKGAGTVPTWFLTGRR